MRMGLVMLITRNKNVTEAGVAGTWKEEMI